MSFQEFCNAAKEIDYQTVTTSDFFVISFSKPDGSAFSINPKDIVSFLRFLSEQHKECKSAIENEPRFVQNKTYLNYQEKPYRALYKLAGKSGLKTISSLGGSQTKELTKIISKLLTYTARLEYKKVEEQTYFDENSVDIALSNMPNNLRVLGENNLNSNALIKNQFKEWLSIQGLSKRTIQSYAETCISEADKLLGKYSISQVGLYNIKLTSELEKIKSWLDSNDVWKEKNSAGNGMYRAGVNKFIEFMESKSKIISIPKPFILLAGISGTGKTRFVREQAAAHNIGDKNFCLVPVRPDWHEPSDLLGYMSRIGGRAEYVSTKVLQFVIDAWKSVAPNADKDGMGVLNLRSAPYWLCLDEMNLAPVEQYFADYLSVLESRKFCNGSYSCNPLLDKSVLETKGADIQKDLKLSDQTGLWEFFCSHGISLPPNLIVAGTVNMDETTHGFSRKVIDRAFTIDFGEFYPNDYSKFFEGQAVPKTLSYSSETQVESGMLALSFDKDGLKTIAFLESVNGVLRNTPFELAYRALNELLLHVNAFSPDSDVKLQAVWDDFLMTKVLPRIDGDDDKLRIVVEGNALNLLEKLDAVLVDQLNLIWGEDKKRPDLLRVDAGGLDINDVLCRSRKKIEWMRNRLEINTFTSYWP